MIRPCLCSNHCSEEDWPHVLSWRCLQFSSLKCAGRVCMILFSSFCSLSCDSKLCFSLNKCVRGFGRFVAFTVLSVQGISLWTTTCDSLKGSASAAVSISTLSLLSLRCSVCVTTKSHGGKQCTVWDLILKWESHWSQNQIYLCSKYIIYLTFIISYNLVTHF